MPLENMISVVFTAAELQIMDDAFSAIEAVLRPKAINLTPEERQQYGSIADTNKIIVDKARDYWNGAYGQLGAKHDNIDPAFYGLSTVYVNSALTGHMPSHDPIDWFVDDASGTEYICAPLNCSVFASQMQGFGQSEQSVAQGTFSPPLYTPEETWTSEKHLFKKLENDPQLIEAGSIMDSFFVEKLNTPIGELSLLEKDKENMFTLEENDSTALATNVSDIHYGIFQAEESNQQWLVYEEGSPEQAIAEAAKLAQIRDLATLSEEGEAMTAALQMGVTTTAEQLFDVNESINATTLDPETNEKWVNEIELTLLSQTDGEISPSQLVILRAIAGQCPLKGGVAVYRARALLAFVETPFYDDEDLCLQVGILYRQSEEIVKGNPITLFPNPASEMVNVRLTNNSSVQTLTVANALGNEVYRVRLGKNTNSCNINVNELSPGIYVIRIQGDGFCEESKLVIVR